MLFKYLEPDRIDVLDSNLIRFTQPADFNDPFEFKPVISTLASKEEMDEVFESKIKSLIKTELEKIPPELRKLISPAQLEALTRQNYSQYWPEINKQFLAIGGVVAQTFSEKSNGMIGVLSLTEKNSNLLMWAHYARSHTGFCIGFDDKNPFFNHKRSDRDEFYHLRKVEYAKDRPTKRVMELTGVELLLVKSEDWFYEQEWRMCAVLSDSDKVIEAETYPIHLFNFPKSAVKEVILGARIANKKKDKLLNVLGSKYENVVVKQAIISPTEFKIELVEL